MKMRFAFAAVVISTASITILSASSRAAPSPSLKEATNYVAGGMIHKVDYWRRYYRRHGIDYWRPYYRSPAPPTPVRPLSCGEFRFWDGERCVDVRFR